MELSKDQKLRLKIEKLSLGGDGIARFSDSQQEPSSNFVFFVPYSVPGEEVDAVITEKRKNFGRAAITKIVTPGPDRISPPCPYFFSPAQGTQNLPPMAWCGGCNFQHLRYESQLAEKVRMLKETIEKIAGFSSDCVLPVLETDPDSQWRYRNKIQIPFGNSLSIKTKTGKSETVAGFFAPDSHQIVPLEDCLIHPEEMMSFVRFVKVQMNKLELPGYSEKDHRGWLRNLIVREQMSTREMLATFVTLNDSFPRMDEWLAEIKRLFPKIMGICQNVNPQKTNVIIGKKWKKIWGRDFLIEEFDTLGHHRTALKLKVSASSFFQVNTKIAEKLYHQVKNCALAKEGTHSELLLDLYCGVGGIGLSCASHFKKVIGVDETISSIRDAKENVLLNDLQNCEFYCRDVLSFLKSGLIRSFPSSSATMILDPPRAGCSADVLSEIARIHPRRIIYVSCEPSTLARDLKFLCAKQYVVSAILPVDLFPQSSHIESIAVIESALHSPKK